MRKFTNRNRGSKLKDNSPSNNFFIHSNMPGNYNCWNSKSTQTSNKLSNNSTNSLHSNCNPHKCTFNKWFNKSTISSSCLYRRNSSTRHNNNNRLSNKAKTMLTAAIPLLEHQCHHSFPCNSCNRHRLARQAPGQTKKCQHQSSQMPLLALLVL